MLNYKSRLNPTPAQAEQLAWTLDTCRQVYNHFLHRLNRVENTSSYNEQQRLPKLKEWWDDLRAVHSKMLQKVVQRLYDNLSTLRGLKENGHRVGQLRWKGAGYYHSFTYSQSGFKLDQKSDRDELWLSKIGSIPVVAHRDLPTDATVKSVTVKREPTGKWYAVLSVETPDELPEKPTNPENVVGIDVGILKFAHDTDGTAVGSLDLSHERERLEHEQRVLSRREHGSNNYREQQRKVARRHADIKRKRRDFLHKLSTWYAENCDLVAVEDLDAKGLMQLDGNSRNRASAAWGTFRRMLEYKCEREGTHFAEVRPHGTTKECAQCGAETDKPLWVREHSCPACGFTADRDENAAWNVLQRGIDQIGMGNAESTPAETVVPTATTFQPVAANHVAETGSPTLKREPSGER
ncbi:RNA-guided endonuclease InsQ/TnpB family protein [Halococcus salsus]|uniref:RNA-guided endonuclease InsQ/TnpB family protein n=1 Tax=Halococcus salsus TaxID=2162894 RepID=UPI001359CFA7|nr:RNA-guided endonuclease TnpB family protein [Halococcus salsus]